MIGSSAVALAMCNGGVGLMNAVLLTSVLGG